MLTKGASKTGRLNHELIERVKSRYGYKSERAICEIWRKYKPEIMVR